jgi:hypothetical protein
MVIEGENFASKKCPMGDARWLTALLENGIMTVGFAAGGRVMF